MHTYLGPALGAALYVVLEVFISGRTEYWPLAMGLIIVGLVLLMPEGLTGFTRRKNPWTFFKSTA